MTTGDDDLIEPGGQGADGFDVPSVFFLTHRERIERWYALKAPANRAIHEYLSSFADDIAAIGEPYDLQCRLFRTSPKFQSLLLWPVGGALDPGKSSDPFIAAGIRWLHTDTAIDDEARCPRVGVRVGPGRAELREAFLDGGQPPARLTLDEHGYRRDTPWPVYRKVPGDAGWWADLDAYRASVVREVETVVALFADGVRSAYPGSGSVDSFH